MIDRVKEAPKLFPSYIQRKKKGRPSVGPLKLSDGSIISDCTDMSNAFVNAFASVFVEDIPLHPAPAQHLNYEMGEIHFSAEMLRDALLSLNANSSMSPDDLHPQLLKYCLSSLAYPMYIIFQRSLLNSQLPEDWKTSIVIPIFKSKVRYNPLNYRPLVLHLSVVRQWRGS